MDQTNWRVSFTSMLNDINIENQQNPENQTHIPNYPYPPYAGYPPMPLPNYGGTAMPMYNYAGFYPPPPPPPPGYGMVGNYSSESSTTKVRSMLIPEDNISANMSFNEELSDTPVPPFCTQQGLQDNVTVGEKKNVREKWSVAEEKALAEAWVSISTDASIGTNQDGDAFWKRVTTYFNKYNKEGSKRNTDQVKSRYFRAQPEINRFNDIYNQINNQYLSGWSDDQKKQAAREEYRNDKKGNKKNFNLEHMWEIIKDYGKWNSAREDKGKSEQTSGSKRTSSNTEEEVGTRPMGTKAAKARKKGKNRKSKGRDDSDDDELAKFNSIQKEKLAMMKQMSMTIHGNSMMDEIVVLNADTSGMTDEAKRLHQILADQIREKYNM